jgi:hypothetical protein
LGAELEDGLEAGGGGGGGGLDGGVPGTFEIFGRGVADLPDVSRLILCHSILAVLQAVSVAGAEVVAVGTNAGTWGYWNPLWRSRGEFLIRREARALAF